MASRDVGSPVVLELATGFAQQGEQPRRTGVSQLFRVASQEGRFSYAAIVGWTRLWETSGPVSARWNSPSNLAFGGSYLLARSDPTGLSAEVGLHFSLRIGDTAPSIHRRTALNARVLAMAMEGLWTAWLWSPSPFGLLLPLRLRHGHALGSFLGIAVAELGYVFGRRGVDPQRSEVGTIAQGRLGYYLMLRPWLVVGGAAQIVTFPSAEVFRAQTAVRALAAVSFGRYQAGTELVCNLDEPYGWGPRGQGIWAAHLRLGARF